MKVVLKGIVTREDAMLSRDAGVEGVQGAIPVFVDGGIRRGTDIFEALALGVRSVCIGSPYLWGLGAFGQAGVEVAIDMFRKELTPAMRQCGTRNLAEIKPALVRRVSA